MSSITLHFGGSSSSGDNRDERYRYMCNNVGGFMGEDRVRWSSVTQYLCAHMFSKGSRTFKRIYHASGNFLKIKSILSQAVVKEYNANICRVRYSLTNHKDVSDEWGRMEGRVELLMKAIKLKFEQNPSFIENLLSTGTSTLRYNADKFALLPGAWVVPHTESIISFIREKNRTSSSINGYIIPTQIEDSPICPTGEKVSVVTTSGELSEAMTVSVEYAKLVKRVINMTVRVCNFEGCNIIDRGMAEDAILSIIYYNPQEQKFMRGAEVCFGYMHYLRSYILTSDSVSLYDKLPNFSTLYEATKILLDKIDSNLTRKNREYISFYISSFVKWLLEYAPEKQREFVVGRLEDVWKIDIVLSPNKRHYRSTTSFPPHVIVSSPGEGEKKGIKKKRKWGRDDAYRLEYLNDDGETYNPNLSTSRLGGDVDENYGGDDSEGVVFDEFSSDEDGDDTGSSSDGDSYLRDDEPREYERIDAQQRVRIEDVSPKKYSVKRRPSPPPVEQTSTRSSGRTDSGRTGRYNEDKSRKDKIIHGKDDLDKQLETAARNAGIRVKTNYEKVKRGKNYSEYLSYNKPPPPSSPYPNPSRIERGHEHGRAHEGTREYERPRTVRDYEHAQGHDPVYSGGHKQPPPAPVFQEDVPQPGPDKPQVEYIYSGKVNKEEVGQTNERGDGRAAEGAEDKAVRPVQPVLHIPEGEEQEGHEPGRAGQDQVQ